MSEGKTHSIKTNTKSSRPDHWRQSTENAWIWWGHSFNQYSVWRQVQGLLQNDSST